MGKKLPSFEGADLKVGGKGMKGFYGSPNVKISGSEVYRLSEKNKSENNEALEDYKKQITSNEYSVIKLPISELIKGDEDLAQFIKDEKVQKGRKVGSPIIIGEKVNDMSPNVKDGVIDGWHRISQALVNGETEIEAYVPTNSKFYKEGSLGIVGNVAKSLFKQEPKTVEIVTDKNTLLNESYSEEQPDGQYKIWNGQDRKWEYDLTETDANKRANKLNEKYVKKTTSTQHSIDITPELKAETQQGLPMFQKIEDLPRFNQRQITDEFIDEDWDTWTSAITLISAKDSYVNALAIIDEIIAKRKYQNDDDELNDLLDDIIDFDNSDFRNHHTAVLYNNALQNNYIRFALTARAQSLYEKSTNDETKKLAKYIIGMSRLEIPTDKGIMSLFLPANMNTDKVNKKNSYKESGEQRTDIEEAKFVRDETKKRILEHLEESGNIDDVINRLLDKIESGQISQPIGFTSPKNTIDVDKKTWAKNKSDKYVSKGLDLIKNGLSHFKKLGVVPDPQAEDGIRDI